MDELKAILELVGNLPNMALWVIAAFWAYKVIIIGSVYGLIRFGIEKGHSAFMAQKTKVVDARIMIGKHTISGHIEELERQLVRCKHYTGHFIHDKDVDWLREAIDAQIEKDKVVKRERETGRAS